MRTLALPRAIGLLLVTTSCAYHNPTQPTPTSISDTAPAFVTLGLPSPGTVSAYVQNAHGAPLEGVTVQFSADSGTLSPVSAPTKSDGRAASTLSASSDTHVTATVGTLTARVTVLAPVIPPPTIPPTNPPGPTQPPPLPVPSIFLNVSSTATTGVSLAFGVSGPATGAPWQWSFGDGASTQTTGFSTSHTYVTTGSYTATVVGVGTGSASTTITVSDPPPPPPNPPAPAPVLSISLGASPSSLFVDASANLTAMVTRQNGAPAPTSYAWDCKGDGSAIVITGSSTQSCTYPNPGSVTSRVTVTGGSVTGSGSTVVTVAFAPLSVNIAPPVPVLTAGLTNTFTATVTSAANPPTALQWQWDFQNDGTTENTNVSGAVTSNSQGFIYTTTGLKTVKVIVTDLATGRSATNTVAITVP